MKKFFSLLSLLLAVCLLAAIPVSSFAISSDFVLYDFFPGVPDVGMMDFSWMNEMPAGQHGFVQSVDGNFQFEDGTPVKLWGTVCGFDEAYPQKENSPKIAADLASMGVNFVRIHAIDCIFGGLSAGIVNFADYNGGLGTGPKGFVDDLLDRLDYLVFCLKEKGIYVHLDTSAGRRVTIGEGFEQDEVDISRGYNLRGASFWDDRCSRIEYDYAKAFLVDHVNPYTNLAYCNDPAIAVIQRINESSSLWVDWGGAGNTDNGFTRKLTAKFNAWLVDKYGTREALAKAWTDDNGVCGLPDDQDPTQGTVTKGTLGNWSEPSVSWSTSFSSSYNPAKHADWIDFLNYTQQTDFKAFYSLLRDNGYKGSINCSNIMCGMDDLYNNYIGDVTEMNWYFNCGDKSVTHSLTEYGINRQDSLLQYFTHATTDKPFVVTEWEVGGLTTFHADTYVTVASYACLQDWDGFTTWIYGSSYPLWDMSRGMVEPKNDPALFGQMGFAAMIFRLGLVSVAEKTIAYTYTDTDVLGITGTPLPVSNLAVYISKYATRYIGDTYTGDDDVVIASSSFASGDYTAAKNLVLQKNSPYDTPYRKNNTYDAWIAKNIGTDTTEKSVGGKNFIAADHRLAFISGGFSFDPNLLNGVMREFGVWDDTVGFIDGKAVSDTHELVYDYTNGVLSCETDKVCFITGKIPATGTVGALSYESNLERATVGIVSMETDKSIDTANALYLYAIGKTRNKVILEDEAGLISYMGSGDIYYQDLRGTVSFKSDKSTCTVWGLDADGNREALIPTNKTDDGFSFDAATYITYEIRMDYDGPIEDPQSSKSEASKPDTSKPESSKAQESQSESGDSEGLNPLYIIIPVAAVIVIAAVVVVLVKKKKK